MNDCLSIRYKRLLFIATMILLSLFILTSKVNSAPESETNINHEARHPFRQLRNAVGAVIYRDLEYVAGGHERHKLDIFLPGRGDEPFPLIIWIHGGGWRGGSKENCLPLRMGYLDHGFAIASINYRLSSHAVFPAQIEDCKAAVRWLRANADKYRLDPDRFGVWGSSAGGHLAALLGVTGDIEKFDVGENHECSSRVRAVCDYYGPTDFLAFAAERSKIWQSSINKPEAALLGALILENPEKSRNASPVSYVTPDDPPFLIVHGDRDFVVPISQSRLLFEALKNSQVEVHFHTIRGAGHGQGFGGALIDDMVRAFFDRHLKADEPPELGKATETESEAAPPAGWIRR